MIAVSTEQEVSKFRVIVDPYLPTSWEMAPGQSWVFRVILLLMLKLVFTETSMNLGPVLEEEGKERRNTFHSVQELKYLEAE